MPENPSSSEAEAASAQLDHIGVAAWRLSECFVKLLLARLRLQGYDDLTTAHSSLLPYLDIVGTRSSVLAERLGVTKQATGQLINELERRGYLRREPDPQDARAKIVRYTDKGLQFLTDARKVKEDLQGVAERTLGAKRLAELQSDLDRLEAAFRKADGR